VPGGREQIALFGTVTRLFQRVNALLSLKSATLRLRNALSNSAVLGSGFHVGPCAYGLHLVMGMDAWGSTGLVFGCIGEKLLPF
jgi:hypothetical protein